MTFLELAYKILLQDVKQPLTANEIWTLAIEKGYDKQLNSEGKTPWATLGTQLYFNAKDNPKSPFKQTDSRPKKFYLKSQANQLNLSVTAISKEPTVVKKKRFDFLLTIYIVIPTRLFTHNLPKKNLVNGFTRPWLAATFRLTTGSQKFMN